MNNGEQVVEDKYIDKIQRKLVLGHFFKRAETFSVFILEVLKVSCQGVAALVNLMRGASAG